LLQIIIYRSTYCNNRFLASVCFLRRAERETSSIMTRVMYYYFNTMTHCICLGDGSTILSWHLSRRRRWKSKRDCFVAVEILLKWHYCCILSSSSYLYIIPIIMAIADRPTYGTADASAGRRRLHTRHTYHIHE